MSEVRHGNLVNRSYCVVRTRWWGLGIRSLAEVAPRWPLTCPEQRALGVAVASVQKIPRASQGDEAQALRGVFRRKTARKVARILRQESAKARRVVSPVRTIMEGDLCSSHAPGLVRLGGEGTCSRLFLHYNLRGLPQMFHTIGWH